MALLTSRAMWPSRNQPGRSPRAVLRTPDLLLPVQNQHMASRPVTMILLLFEAATSSSIDSSMISSKPSCHNKGLLYRVAQSLYYPLLLRLRLRLLLWLLLLLLPLDLGLL